MADDKDKNKSSVVSGTSKETMAFLNIIAKNSYYIPKMAEDLNIARRNLVSLVKIKGGLATNAADKSFLNTSSAEKELEREKEKYNPTPAKPKRESKKKSGFFSKMSQSKFGKKIGGIFGVLKSIFSIGNIIKAVAGLGIIGGILSYFWDSITQAWEEWKANSGIWEAITEGLDNVLGFFNSILDNDFVKGLTSSVSEFFAPVTKAVGEFFGGFYDWFADKFDIVKKMFSTPIAVKKIPEQKLEVGNKAKDVVPPAPPKTPEPPPPPPPQAPVESKEDREKRAKEDEVRKLYEQEEKVKYHGRDEIVRARMGLQEKSANDLAKEYGLEAPTGKPTPVTAAQPSAPTPAPAAKPPSTKPTPETKGTAINVGSDDKWIMDMIKKHEGVKTRPYKDSLGLWTVGVGHLIGNGKTLPKEWDREFSMQEIDQLFAADYEHHKQMAMKMPGFSSANKATQGALIDLAFNMGGAWYEKWPKFMKAFVSGNMQQAAEELRDSAWFTQVKGRAVDIINLIKSGGNTTPTPAVKPVSSPVPAAPTGTVSKGNISLNSVTKTQGGVDLNINSEFANRVAAMAADFKQKTGKTLLITSAYRSNEKQKELWDAKVKSLGGNEAEARKKVAPPAPPLGYGKGSQHSSGMALDINSKGAEGLNVLAGSREKSTGWLEKFGLIRPVNGEDWHIQPSGTVGTPDNPDSPGTPVLVADKSGNPIDVDTGKADSISSAVIPNSLPSGQSISSTSTEVDVGQREQQKQPTPYIINAPVTNNTVIASNTPPEAPPENTSGILSFFRKLLS